jgi:hypothetical protein
MVLPIFGNAAQAAKSQLEGSRSRISDQPSTPAGDVVFRPAMIFDESKTAAHISKPWFNFQLDSDLGLSLISKVAASIAASAIVTLAS